MRMIDEGGDRPIEKLRLLLHEAEAADLLMHWQAARMIPIPIGTPTSIADTEKARS